MMKAWRRDWGAFVVAAFAAPALSVVFAILLTAASIVFSSQGEGLSALSGLLFSLIVGSIAATVCGVIPAIVFGAPIFWILVAARASRPGAFVYVLGGTAAAALYVLSALALAGTEWHGLRWMYFWVLSDPAGSRSLGEAAKVLVAAIVASGAGAGFIAFRVHDRG
jgi:hypothetical protein